MPTLKSADDSECRDRADAGPSPLAALNDAFRRSFSGGRVMLTRGVAELPVLERCAVLASVRAFDAFTAGNDPYGEHDFGAVEHGGKRYFWKIDYYDRELTYASPDPINPAVTTRVQTIMRADEY